MAFLFQDQNQGIRNEESRTPKRISQGARVAATVLFHPDFNRRPRICTESADPSPLEGRRSRAWAHRPYRRWGLSPRPENIGRLGMSRPAEKYDERSALQQAAWPGNFSWSPCREREPFLMPRRREPFPLRSSRQERGSPCERGEAGRHRIKDSPPPKVNNFLPALFRFRFVLLLTNALWTADSHVVES